MENFKIDLNQAKAKLIFSKTIFDENSEEQVPLIINNLNVGTYTLGTYSKWYSQRLDKGERTIPNVGKFVNGLLMQKYGIDTRNWGSDNNILENDLKTIGCNNIGEWFDKYMESNID